MFKYFTFVANEFGGSNFDRIPTWNCQSMQGTFRFVQLLKQLKN